MNNLIHLLDKFPLLKQYSKFKMVKYEKHYDFMIVH